jgi:hypothetical protein
LPLVRFYLVHLHQMRAAYLRTVRRCALDGVAPVARDNDRLRKLFR